MCSLKTKTSGKCGENEEECKWTYFHYNQTLNINGKGEMIDYLSSEEVPWNLKKDIIETIYIEGISLVGSYAFNDMSNLEKVEYKGNTISCGENVFEDTKIGYIFVPNGFEQNDFCGLSLAKWNTEGTKAIIDKEGDEAPYNGEPEYSINTEKANALGFQFSPLKDWIYELLDYYIQMFK